MRTLGAVALALDLGLMDTAAKIWRPETTMKTNLPENVLAALSVTHRATGWNFRPARTMRFDLPNQDGTSCRLLVVPYRRWVQRRSGCSAAPRYRGGAA